MANYDPTRNDVGYIRLLISDTANDAVRLFSDEEITEVLRRETTAKGAAATLLLIIAGNEALIAKAIRTQDLQTDGPAVAAEIRAQAAVYRAEANTELAATPEAPSIIEYVDDSGYPPELAAYRGDWLLSLG